MFGPLRPISKKVLITPRILTVCWSGRESRYHSIWLHENASDETTVNLATRERRPFYLTHWTEIAGAEIDETGALCVDFALERRRLHFLPGWLRAHDYGDTGDPEVPLSR